MSPGDGIKGTRVSGTHSETDLRTLVGNAGGQVRQVGQPHPADGGIRRMEYRIPNQTGGYGPWRTKTVYNMPTGTFVNLTRQAVRNALINNSGTLPSTWSGVTRTGMRIEGYATQIGPNKYRITSAFFSKW